MELETKLKIFAVCYVLVISLVVVGMCLLVWKAIDYVSIVGLRQVVERIWEGAGKWKK